MRAATKSAAEHYCTETDDEEDSDFEELVQQLKKFEVEKPERTAPQQTKA